VKYLRLILLPFGYLYGFIVEGIKLTYRLGWCKSSRFELPTIIIGNLSTGGTGKTPHVEYILKNLGHQFTIAVLSRGYGRKTKGFMWVEPTDAAADVGDEPLQVRKKYPKNAVVVAEKRAAAIPKILNKLPQTQLLLLDDGMQHWPVIGDSYIMLTTYSSPFFNDFVLPAGNLREFRFNYRRSNTIIVTKCPPNINEQQRAAFLKKIKPGNKQKVYFSYMKYGQPYHILETERVLKWEALLSINILLVVGIANPKPLKKYLSAHSKSVQLFSVPDHHNYSQEEWKAVLQKFDAIESSLGATIIISTEKDALRLIPFVSDINIPLYIVPIEIAFAFGEDDAFQRTLIEVIDKKIG